MDYLLAIDQGTTSCRSIIFDIECQIIALSQQEITQYYPAPGYVEQDANEIWSVQCQTIIEAFHSAQITNQDLKAIGITNQRETTIIWDKHTGIPIYNGIVWQDRRTSTYCKSLIDAGYESIITEKTGLLCDPYFCATKIHWLLKHVVGAQRSAERGDLLFGTIDSWLIWKLTNGRKHVIDATNASRTLLFNIYRKEWDDELLKLFGIPSSILPQVSPSVAEFGNAHINRELSGIPICGVAGDQQASLFGHACFDKSMAKCTYGTGCFLLLNTEKNIIRSRNRLLSTIAWQIADETVYALEGSVFVGGAAIQWLRDGLRIFQQTAESEAIAQQVPDSGGVYLVPAYAGLGAPYWDPNARGLITGITRGTTLSHITRATLDAIAFQVADLVSAMTDDAQIELKELRVDGGASANDFLLQIQANLLGIPVIRPKCIETTALGAAYLAGHFIGIWKEKGDIAQQWQHESTFEPKISTEQAQDLREKWRHAVQLSRDWGDYTAE